MSMEMKRAIKAHLKSDTDHGIVAMDVESDEGNAANVSSKINFRSDHFVVHSELTFVTN